MKFKKLMLLFSFLVSISFFSVPAVAYVCDNAYGKLGLGTDQYTTAFGGVTAQVSKDCGGVLSNLYLDHSQKS
jgi:hypothetical protein